MLNAADDACTAASRFLTASNLIFRRASTLSRNARLASSSRRCGDTHGADAAVADDADGPAAAAAAGGCGPPPAEDDDDDDACLGRDDADDDDDDDWWCAGYAGPIPDDGGATDIGSDLDDACEFALAWLMVPVVVML